MYMRWKRMGALLLAAACAVWMTACGDSGAQTIVTGTYYNPAADTDADADAGQEESAEETAKSSEETLGTDQFMITSNDMQAECLVLIQLATGKQYMYNYSLTTRFLDKYGDRAPVSSFEPGRVICVGGKDVQGRLLEVQISGQVWEYPDVTRYEVDEARGVFRIAETDYSYDEGLFIHSDGNRQRLSDLTDMDTLRVVGFGRKILSVAVTSGHGELTLRNTSLFKGSYIQVGRCIFEEITGEMTIKVPEGTYTVAVANNGYGGSTEIEIQRGEETVLDLDALKGEGPKYGKILFAVDVLGAVLRIDGYVVDYSQPVSLQYGVHTLSVSATGYDTITKRLFVNSATGTIVIGLTGTDDTVETGGTAGTENTSNSADGTSSTTGSLAGSLAGSHSSGVTSGGLAGSLAGSHSSGATSGSSGTVTGGVTSQAELDAIIEGLLDDDDSSSDYLSTILDALSKIVGD